MWLVIANAVMFIGAHWTVGLIMVVFVQLVLLCIIFWVWFSLRSLVETGTLVMPACGLHLLGLVWQIRKWMNMIQRWVIGLALWKRPKLIMVLIWMFWQSLSVKSRKSTTCRLVLVNSWFFLKVVIKSWINTNGTCIMLSGLVNTYFLLCLSLLLILRILVCVGHLMTHVMLKCTCSDQHSWMAHFCYNHVVGVYVCCYAFYLSSGCVCCWLNTYMLAHHLVGWTGYDISWTNFCSYFDKASLLG